MTDYTKAFGSYSCAETAIRVFKFVYGWMAAGLALSGLVAYWFATSGMWKTVMNGPMFLTLAAVEIVLVICLCACVQKIPTYAAYLIYAAYAVLNGMTLSSVFLVYETASIASTFFITAGMFGGIALYGTVTNSDLTKMGSICGMALWGLLLAMLVNMFVGNGFADTVISAVTVIVFAGLTAYDAQKIKGLAEGSAVRDEDEIRKYGILGALTLYLDFVNLFLHILRLIGKIKK